jgi:ketosteroid isomerase-like protein
LDLFSTLSSEDFTWETPGNSPRAGLRKGRAEVYAQYGTYLNDTGGTFKAQLQSVTSNGNGEVVGVHRNTGTRNGKTLDTMCCIVFAVKDGKIESGKEHFFDLYNWDQFWS